MNHQNDGGEKAGEADASEQEADPSNTQVSNTPATPKQHPRNTLATP